jgi:hypothetical protein
MRSLELHDFFQHRCDLNLPLHLEEYWQSICPHEPQQLQLEIIIIATYYMFVCRQLSYSLGLLFSFQWPWEKSCFESRKSLWGSSIELTRHVWPSRTTLDGTREFCRKMLGKPSKIIKHLVFLSSNDFNHHKTTHIIMFISELWTLHGASQQRCCGQG